ncbi:hypothetical protein [Microlunatus soli]|uniref:ATP/GTP-binding protein n=1 Tax=Microlunatus soli TaxID=630515 RepID=A0A1H1ZWG6_9ACTN|nr:hypothetical protein [Microlunatus soli]SDT38003.1 hypothetical protein SAMN04489812_5501 [Microlunatus soli]
MAPSQRRRSKHLRPARPLGVGHATSSAKSDGRWIVRTVAGSSALKDYRCPGCNQLIRPGTPHVVVWPSDSHTGGIAGSGGVADRRHWHNSCWSRRR